jgi:hypothetical protein
MAAAHNAVLDPLTLIKSYVEYLSFFGATMAVKNQDSRELRTTI